MARSGADRRPPNAPSASEQWHTDVCRHDDVSWEQRVLQRGVCTEYNAMQKEELDKPLGEMGDEMVAPRCDGVCVCVCRGDAMDEYGTVGLSGRADLLDVRNHADGDDLEDRGHEAREPRRGHLFNGKTGEGSRDKCREVHDTQVAYARATPEEQLWVREHAHNDGRDHACEISKLISLCRTQARQTCWHERLDCGTHDDLGTTLDGGHEHGYPFVAPILLQLNGCAGRHHEGEQEQQDSLVDEREEDPAALPVSWRNDVSHKLRPGGHTWPQLMQLTTPGAELAKHKTSTDKPGHGRCR